MTVIHIQHLSNFLLDLQSTYKVKWLETKIFKKWYLQNKEIKTTKLGRSKTQTQLSFKVESPNQRPNYLNQRKRYHIRRKKKNKGINVTKGGRFKTNSFMSQGDRGPKQKHQKHKLRQVQTKGIIVTLSERSKGINVTKGGRFKTKEPKSQKMELQTFELMSQKA